MHYTGMLAQRTNLQMTVMAPFVVLSCIVAFVTANAAFWIIFRLVQALDLSLIIIPDVLFSTASIVAIE